MDDILDFPRRKVVGALDMSKFFYPYPLNGLEPSERVEIADAMFPAIGFIIAKTANFTAGATEGGVVFTIGADAVVATLPATILHRTYTFLNIGADAAQSFTIAPNASDLINGLSVTAADDKDFLIPKAGTFKGDFIQLIGNGTTGWEVVSARGAWVREA